MGWIDINSGTGIITWHDTTKSDTKEYYEKPEGTNWESMTSTVDKDVSLNLTTAANGKLYVVLRRPKDIGH